MSKPDPHMYSEVLVVTEKTSPEAIAAYLFDGGPMPEGAYEETFEEYSARGRVHDCDCQLIQCVCLVKRQHQEDCRFRVSLTCAVPIECEHGVDVCPHCDKCDCR